MFKHRVGLMMILVLLAQPARAFFDPPYITPALPIAGQPISVNIRGGICDAIIGLPGYPQVTQEGNAITILFFGVRNSNPEDCYYAVGAAAFPVGSYEPGSYTLNVKLRYIGGTGLFLVDTLGVVPFTVTGGVPPPAPVSAPTLSIAGLILFLLALAGIATRCLYSRRT
jgi:hypothetical protein